MSSLKCRSFAEAERRNWSSSSTASACLCWDGPAAGVGSDGAERGCNRDCRIWACEGESKAGSMLVGSRTSGVAAWVGCCEGEGMEVSRLSQDAFSACSLLLVSLLLLCAGVGWAYGVPC